MAVYGFTNEQTTRRVLRLLNQFDVSKTNQIYNPIPKRQIFKNGYTTPVPPFAAMRVTDVIEFNGRDAFETTRPTSEPGLFVFNGPREVKANGGGGACFAGPIVKASYVGTDPAVGDLLGVNGWDLEIGGSDVLSVKAYGTTADGNLLGNPQAVSEYGLIIATSTAEFSITSGTVNATLTEVLGGQVPDDTGDTITVYNSADVFSGSIGDKLICLLRSDGDYELIQKAC